MKIIDNNGRLFGKISIIDVIVLLVAVVLAAALYMKTNTMTHTSTAPTYDTITYTVICHGMPSYVEDSIRVGDSIYDEDNLNVGSLGEIIDVQYLPGTEFVKIDDGTASYVPKENSVNVLLTIRGKGSVEGNNYMLNRIYHLGVNANRNLCTPYVHLRGIVASIEK